ncbi:MAG: (Fe-S)-binding protein [Bacteroidetes bacterium]|nr:(Fe-S)-binding protein [Bacteroidota bacterium]
MKSNFTLIDPPSNDVITNCMHCGLCLPTCPTYQLTGLENSSPRGRIRLIKSVAEGKLAITEGFIEEMNFCLDCQACETACPAGVKYGSLVEAARNQIRLTERETIKEKILKRIFLRGVLSHKFQLKLVARLLYYYQNSGAEWFVQKTGILKIFSKKLNKIQHLSPRIDKVFFDEQYPEILKPEGETKYRIGFLSGCIMSVAFTKVHEDTIKVLLHHNCEIIIPKNQTCCGSLQAHNGDFDIARELAKKNIDVFLEHELDAIVMDSAGCGALMKEYGHYLKDDPVYSEKAKKLSAKVKDLSEFLFEIGLKNSDTLFNHVVSYHDACHLVHAQQVSSQPRSLIQNIPGVRYVELPEASWCCGSAGIYNVVRNEDAEKVLSRKMKNISSITPEYLVANNPGCIGQIEHGLKEQKLNVRVVHLATLLREAYGL